MPHYVPNEYPNIFGCNILTERISQYIRIPKIARIQIWIIFEGHFIRIFKYSYSSLIEENFEKHSLMFPLNRILHWIYFIHRLYLDLFFSLTIDSWILKKGSEQILKYNRIFENLRTNIQIYSVVKKSTNKYPNIFILGKWHKYEYE